MNNSYIVLTFDKKCLIDTLRFSCPPGAGAKILEEHGEQMKQKAPKCIFAIISPEDYQEKVRDIILTDSIDEDEILKRAKSGELDLLSYFSPTALEA